MNGNMSELELLCVQRDLATIDLRKSIRDYGNAFDELTYAVGTIFDVHSKTVNRLSEFSDKAEKTLDAKTLDVVAIVAKRSIYAMAIGGAIAVGAFFGYSL